MTYAPWPGTGPRAADEADSAGGDRVASRGSPAEVVRVVLRASWTDPASFASNRCAQQCTGSAAQEE
jgi:hypothetical protein